MTKQAATKGAFTRGPRLSPPSLSSSIEPSLMACRQGPLALQLHEREWLPVVVLVNAGESAISGPRVFWVGIVI